LFSGVSYCLSTGPFFRYLSTVTVTYEVRDSYLSAQNDSRHLWDYEIDHAVLLYYSLSAVS